MGNFSTRMTIRKQLGYLKFKLVDQLPYQFLRMKGERFREDLKGKTSELPAIAPAGGPAVDVQMLCGKKHLDMGIWASWSLMRFIPSARLVVFSDGTLSEADLGEWRRVIPNLTLISSEANLQRSDEVLKGRYPLLHEWREKNLYNAKFLGFHFHGGSDRIILLDSDVLCFQRPDELIAGLGAPVPVLRWHNDVTSCYLGTIPELEAASGHPVPACVNSGFMLAKRWTEDDLKYLNEMFEKLNAASLPLFHFWSEQTYYALTSPRHADAKPFSNKYSIYYGRTNPERVIRHYVGVVKVRPRFYVEGIPILLDQIRSAGL
jgi:hypothetical protein